LPDDVAVTPRCRCPSIMVVAFLRFATATDMAMREEWRVSGEE
jgi:hypothetical protein